MISCERAWELLSQQLDEPLSPQEKQELEEHLAACPACRKEQEELAQLDEALRGLKEIEAPADFAARVMDQVRAEPRESRKVIPLWRPQMRALAGLAACALLCIGIYRAVPQGTTPNAGVATASLDVPSEQEDRIADAPDSTEQENTHTGEQPAQEDTTQQSVAQPRAADLQPETDKSVSQQEIVPQQTQPYSGAASDSQGGEVDTQGKAQLPHPTVVDVQTVLTLDTLSTQAAALLPALEDWSVDEQGSVTCTVSSQVLEGLCQILDEEGTEYTVSPKPWSETCVVSLRQEK